MGGQTGFGRTVGDIGHSLWKAPQYAARDSFNLLTGGEFGRRRSNRKHAKTREGLLSLVSEPEPTVQRALVPEMLPGGGEAQGPAGAFREAQGPQPRPTMGGPGVVSNMDDGEIARMQGWTPEKINDYSERFGVSAVKDRIDRDIFYARNPEAQPQPEPRELETKQLADGHYYHVDPFGMQPPRRVNPDIQTPVETADPVDPWAGVKLVDGRPVRANQDGTFTSHDIAGMSADAAGPNADIKLPAGYQWKMDDAGKSTGIMEPVPGSPQAAAVAAAADEIANAAETRAQGESQQEAQRAIVTETLGDVRKLAQGGWATGLAGTVFGVLPGTDASDMEAKLDTLKGFASFETLQAMRNASPTGGALGQVSERELAMLQSQFGALEQSQSKQSFLSELDKFERLLDTVVNRGMEAASGAPGDQTVMPDYSQLGAADFAAQGAQLFGGPTT